MLKLEEKKNQHYSKHTHHLQTPQARVIVEYGVARSAIKQFYLTFIEMNRITSLKNIACILAKTLALMENS